MNSDFIISKLSDISKFNIDEVKVRAHVVRPAHVLGVVSSKGLEDKAQFPVYEFTFALGTLYRFDVIGFGEAVHAAFKNQVAGYSLQLKQHGSTIYSRSWNYAKTPADGSELWAHDVRMHIASCSKFITAIAMTKLLNDMQMSYDTPIIGFLPNYWAKGPNIDKITFRQLMTHTSGFPEGPSDSDFAFMKKRVSTGVSSVGGRFQYQNMNFGLCRILIATIMGTISPGVTFNIPDISNDALWDTITINTYVKYVTESIFNPAGISGPTLDRPSEDALAYPSPVVGNGWNSGNLTTVSGGVGWHMSTDDLLAIMGTFRRLGTIMSPAQAQALLDNGFGIEIDGQRSTPLGTLYRKGGYWSFKDIQVEQSHLCFLPQDMELVVLVNSPIGSGNESLPGIVDRAYISRIFKNLSLRQFLERRLLPISGSVHPLVGSERSVRKMILG